MLMKGEDFYIKEIALHIQLRDVSAVELEMILKIK